MKPYKLLPVRQPLPKRRAVVARLPRRRAPLWFCANVRPVPKAVTLVLP